MAYTKKPGTPPALDMGAITKKLELGQPLTPTQSKQLIEWKKWVESSDTFDGADKGGLRDVLDANAKALDGLKSDYDKLDDRETTHHTAQAQRLTALEGALSKPPFPA